MNTKKQITKLRAYERNGFPEFLKPEIRGLRRILEREINSYRATKREEKLERLYSN
jgi:hypothetical protein